MIELVFEELARAKGAPRVVFVKVDLVVGMSSVVARNGAAATPTIGFFLDGKKTHGLKGVNAPELRTQVDLLLYKALPSHLHVSFDLPSTVSPLSTEPIFLTQVPTLDTVHDKLASFVDGGPSLANPNTIKDDLAQEIFVWLKQRYVEKSKAPTTPALVAAFGRTVTSFIADLPTASMFPLFHIWRLAILEPTIAKAMLTPPVKVLTLNSKSISSSSRATLLTLLRPTTNALSTPSLSRLLLLFAGAQDDRGGGFTSVLVQTLLPQDRFVRIAAASLAFKVGAWVQRGWVARTKGGREEAVDRFRMYEEEWEIELVSAVVEALAGDEESEDAVHRLTAKLAFLIWLSPFYEDQLVPLLSVLQVGETLKGKLGEDGKLKCGEGDQGVCGGS